MRILGHVLLWCGFVAASFWSVYQRELPERKWMTVPWTWYAVSMAIGIVGVALLRTTAKQIQEDQHVSDSQYSTIRSSLERLATALQKLDEQKHQLQPGEIVHYIDEHCATPLAEFADARQSLLQRFGMQFYADVMTQFASAERYVNRTWSAAADGYVDEVAVSIQRAREHVEQARQLLRSSDGES